MQLLGQQPSLGVKRANGPPAFPILFTFREMRTTTVHVGQDLGSLTGLSSTGQPPTVYCFVLHRANVSNKAGLIGITSPITIRVLEDTTTFGSVARAGIGCQHSRTAQCLQGQARHADAHKPFLS